MTGEESLAGGGNDRRLAESIAGEQKEVQTGTTNLSESVAFQQNTLRQLLAQAFGEAGKQSPTELDPVAGQLSGAQEAQRQALASLEPHLISWPKANTAFHSAAGRMRQALEALKSLQPPVKDQDENARPPMNGNDSNEDLDAAGSDTDGKKSPPVSPGDFTDALSMRSLPIPNYTPAEILAEESANQQKRARQKAARAAAKVEKNW